MVALTGIEWVKCRSNAVHPNLSCSFSVHLRFDGYQPIFPGTAWCDRGVTQGRRGTTASRARSASGTPGRRDVSCRRPLVSPGLRDAADIRCVQSRSRRRSDYETIRSSQIAENSFHRASFSPAIQPVAAQVEQFSEQVAAPLPFPIVTTAEVEQVR